MDLPFIPPHQFQAYLLCLARVMALIAEIPAFAGIQMTALIIFLRVV